MTPTTLAERVRRRRQELGLTLKELAQLIGVSESHLSRIENGRSVPSARTVTRLTKVCGFTALPAAADEVGRSATPVGDAPAAVRGSWSFVGRQEELAAIASATADADCGGIVLAGTQGVGKTRLAREALNAAADRGRATAWVSGVREAASMPLGAFARLVSIPDSGIRNQTRLLRSVARSVFGSTGSPRPVLGVDDANLLDDLSAGLVLHMAMSGSVFVVATIRAGERAPDALVALWKDGVAQRLELNELPRSAVMELLGSVLGGYIETTTQYNLWDACQGNALLLHELVLGGIECGALRNEDGVWRWKERPAAGRRMIEVVQSRLATLTEQERDLVEALAIGEPMDVRFAERLASDEVLLQLESRGLIQLESIGGQAQVRLAHPLYGEALRGRSSIRTRWLKRRLAAAATASNNLRPDDVLRVATWQLDAGDDVSAELLTTAAERAELLFAHELAERLAMAAVEVGAGFPAELVVGQALAGQHRHAEAEALMSRVEGSSRSDGERARAALVRGSNLMFGLVQPVQAEEVLRVAEEAIVATGWRGEVAAQRAYVLVWTARAAEGLRLARQVLSDPEATDRARLQALIAVAAGSLNRARFSDVLSAVEQGMPIAGRLGDQMPMAEAQLVAANWWALLGTGRVAPAADLAEAHFGQAVGSRLYDVAAYLAVPYAYSAFAQGLVRTAMRRFTEVMPLLREHDALGDLRLANAMLAQAAAVAGDVRTARSALAVAGGTAPLTARVILSEVFIRLARAALAGQQGDAAGARQLALEAAETARSLQAVALEMVALHSVVCLDDSARVASRLAELSRLAPGPLADAFTLHATASLAGDGQTLDNLVSTFESRGALLSAAEVAVHAAHAHVQAGNRDRARLSWHRARELKRQCEDAETPGLALLSTDEPDPLTAREREIGALAARGLTSREIAKRLGVSIRTVDNHLSHIFGKLQISSRRELRTLLLGPRREGDPLLSDRGDQLQRAP